LNLKFALAIVSVGLMLSLAANIYFYARQNGFAQENGLQKQVADLEGQLANVLEQSYSLQSEKANLESQVLNLLNQTIMLQNENSKLQSENTALQSQLSQPRGPRIITRLGTTDLNAPLTGLRVGSGPTRLYISGEVWNVGTMAAQNCRLHLTLYQGVAIANDTYVELGRLEAGTYLDIATNIYYAGVSLTNWTISPEFD
jgi:hypothetical protein